MRQTITEENLNKSELKLDYYWCPYCNGFHLTSAEIKMKDYDFEETRRPVVAVG